MTMRLLPSAARLTATVNGRTYAGTLNTPYDNIIDADGLALAALGWTVLGPVAGEEDPLALNTATTALADAAAAQTTANGRLLKLTTAQSAVLTTTDFAALSTTDVAALSTASLVALTQITISAIGILNDIVTTLKAN